jgi:hypothetical protein
MARTFETADWKVSSEIGAGVLFDIRDRMRMVVSDSRDIVNRIFTLLLVTVISLDVSGTADVKVHSSSSTGAAAAVSFCAKPDDAPELPTPRRSTDPDALLEVCGCIDCWNWNGDA